MATEPFAMIDDAAQARAMLAPLRQRILAAAHEPASSTTIAASLGLPRQRVNYHVRALADAGLLRRAGRRQRRGLVEQRWVTAARTMVVAPRLIGGIESDHKALDPDLGAAYLLALAATMQREIAVGSRAARRAGGKVPTLALDAELRFADAGQRARFAGAVQAAIKAAIEQHTTASAGGPTYRLALGCYPCQEDPDVPQAPRSSRHRRDHDPRPRRRRVARVG